MPPPSKRPRRRRAGNAPQLVADIVAWRRRALEQQLPDARFPGGVMAPGLVGLTGLVLTAILLFGLFAHTSGRGVPEAVVTSQRDLVRQVVRTTEIGIERNFDELAEVVLENKARTDVTPQALAENIKGQGEGLLWDAVRIIDVGTGQALASAGAAFDLPAGLDPAQGSTTGRFVNGQPQIVYFVPFGEGDVRALVVTSTPKFRSLRLNPDARHGIILGAATGETALLQGFESTTPVDQEQVKQVLQRTVADDRTTSTTGEADARQTALVVTGRPIGHTGFVIISAVRGGIENGGGFFQGYPAASFLIVAALLSAMFTFFGLVRPVRKLLGQAIADASGAPGKRRVIHGPREIVRISAALAAARPPRRGLPVVFSLTIGCLLILIWSGATVFHYGQQKVTVPLQVTTDEAARIESTSTALGNSLEVGLVNVTELAGRLGAERTAESAKPAFDRALRDNRRFRGIYLINAQGDTLLSVGREALRAPGPVPGEGGIELAGVNGRMPVIYAYSARLGQDAVVAEYDVEYLTGILRQKDGRVRVIDSDMHTILDTEGFVAFQPLSDGVVRNAVIGSLTGETSSSILHSTGAGRSEIDAERLIASNLISEPETVAHMEWTVVSERTVTMLNLPVTMRYRAGTLAAGIAGALAMFTLGWQYFFLVRPLRALARDADAISAGRYSEPVPLRRHDEIGAVAACLELCRQVEMWGGSRFGGATRMRGEGDDFTAIISRVKDPGSKRLAGTKGR